MFESAVLGDVFGEKLKGSGIVLIPNGSSREANHRGTSVAAGKIGNQTGEILSCGEVVGEMEPFLRVAVQRSQMTADQLRRGTVAQHVNERGIGIRDCAIGITAADAVGGVGNQGTKIQFRAPQAFLRRSQSCVEGADQQGHEHKQCQMDDGPAVISLGSDVVQGKIGIHRDSKGSSHQAGLPPAVPGAHHDGNREDDQPAFDQV